MDMEISAQNITLGETLNKIKWRLKLELLKKHKLGMLEVRPDGATGGGKVMTWRDVKI